MICDRPHAFDSRCLQLDQLAPLAVHLTPTATPPMCPSLSRDAVTYTSSVTGGNGSYAYAWNGASCSGASGIIDPPDGSFCLSQSFSVNVHDTSGLCPPATSEAETYSKVTASSASNNGGRKRTGTRTR